MPIYTAFCHACEREEDIYRAVDQRNDLPTCCGLSMSRKVTAPYVAPDIAGYQSMATGEWVSSRSAHREHLKRHNLIEIGNEKLDNKPKPVDDRQRKRQIAEIIAAKK